MFMQIVPNSKMERVTDIMARSFGRYRGDAENNIKLFFIEIICFLSNFRNFMSCLNS